MKIALLSLHSSPYGDLGASDTGGMSVYIRETALRMAARGCRLDLFTRRTQPDQPRIVDLQDRLRLIRLAVGPPEPIPKIRLLHYQDEFSNALENYRNEKRGSYDLIHSHYWLSGCVGQKLSDGWNLPHLVSFHTLAAVKDSTGAAEPEPALRLEGEKRIARECTRILAPTEKEKELTHRFYDAPTEKIEVVPGGVDLNLFKPHDKMEARRVLDIPVDEMVVLYVGRFDPMKGIDHVVESIALLNPNLPLRLLLIGGDGEGSPAWIRLRKLTADLAIEESVHFLGRIEHERMPIYYSAADVVTATSHYESFGLAALEALACGTPVVATRVGAMEEVINEKSGCLIDEPFPGNIAVGISHCASHLFRRKTSAEAVRAAVAEYDWSRTAKDLLESYCRLTDR